MNRVAAVISEIEKLKEGKSPEELTALSSAVNIDNEEYCHWQEYKSIAQASGIISLEEALTVYSCLGSGPDHFNAQPLEVKCGVTMIMERIMSAIIQGRT